jgi:hypothetical protein
LFASAHGCGKGEGLSRTGADCYFILLFHEGLFQNSIVFYQINHGSIV